MSKIGNWGKNPSPLTLKGLKGLKGPKGLKGLKGLARPAARTPHPTRAGGQDDGSYINSLKCPLCSFCAAPFHLEMLDRPVPMLAGQCKGVKLMEALSGTRLP